MLLHKYSPVHLDHPEHHEQVQPRKKICLMRLGTVTMVLNTLALVTYDLQFPLSSNSIILYTCASWWGPSTVLPLSSGPQLQLYISLIWSFMLNAIASRLSVIGPSKIRTPCGKTPGEVADITPHNLSWHAVPAIFAP